MTMIDFSKLGNTVNRSQLEPRDIFMSLPSRDKKYEYPRDVQSEVWKKWFEYRNQKNSIIKMNTGSGKTVVGLIILKSCLNEDKGPAVYVVPDNYLIQQVCIEARKLGIKTTTSEDDSEYIRKQAILVINIQKLINGKSVFGMRAINNVNIGCVLIDDVHACLASIESQYTIFIPANDKIYNEFITLFSDAMKSQSENKYSDIVENQDPYVNMLIPFWDWQSKNQEVYALLNQGEDRDYIKFNFPLLKDCLKICNCVISARGIEITPKCIPIHKISSFERAERRIFMSATLADDSVFVTALGLQPEEITSIITPEKANDIGDRLIIFPQIQNKSISDDEVKVKLKALSANYNVVVIVPSYYRSNYWTDVADLTLNYLNIDQGVERLKNGHVGLVVFINKYDGIDLPDDACRLLVIDGLPNMRSEYDAFEQNANPHNKRLCSEQIQKIEQGMGRGVRSNTDYCVVILLGRGLADIIFGSDGYKYFSDVTKQQFQLSEQLWNQLSAPDVDKMFSLADYSLNRDVNWITVSRDTLSSVAYTSTPKYNNTSIALRKAFNMAEVGRYQEAVAILTAEKNQVKDKELKGLLKQSIAEYTNAFNPEEAQQILLSAINDNRMILKPLQGIQFPRILNQTGFQAQYFVNYVSENILLPNTYILKINAVLEELNFSPDSAKRFEAALKDLSFLLGIFSNRPEDEYGKGPDNFWDIGNMSFFVIECKNGTITDTINKHDCNQLNGSINWFEAQYRDANCSCYPIMIHNSNLFDYACSPHQSIRIMTPQLLDSFKNNVRKFSTNVVLPDAFNNPVKVNQLLTQFKLLGPEIVDNFTGRFSVKTR